MRQQTPDDRPYGEGYFGDKVKNPEFATVLSF
jgi:hypothetical protein